MATQRTDIRIPIPSGAVAEFCHSHQVKELALFGSVLRDDFTNQSDVDVLVEFDPDCDYSLFDLVGVEDELSQIIGRKVDLVEKDSVSRYIAEDVLASRRVLYVAP